MVGTVVWWLRRVPGDGAADDGFEVGRPWGLLPPDVEAAFVEGLRAYHDSGGALRGHEELEVLVAYDPPRSISLRLLADAFAARGDAALHDPQGTVAELMAELSEAGRAGVLHLRGAWPVTDLDAMDGGSEAVDGGPASAGAGPEGGDGGRGRADVGPEGAAWMAWTPGVSPLPWHGPSRSWWLRRPGRGGRRPRQRGRGGRRPMRWWTQRVRRALRQRAERTAQRGMPP